jgi:hypothetical protein
MKDFDKQKINNTLIFIIKCLISKSFSDIYTNDFEKSLSVKDLEDSLQYIKYQLEMPPSKEFKKVDIFRTDEKSKILVEINLWYNKQRSNYTLSCMMKNSEKNEDMYEFSIASIHIL